MTVPIRVLLGNTPTYSTGTLERARADARIDHSSSAGLINVSSFSKEHS
jgi:hypothetical protein